MDRLGLVLLPAFEPAVLAGLAGAAEDAGFDAVFTPEAGNDALATAQHLLGATRRVRAGTWIANIYVRHPVLCASAAAFLADLSGGRMILGLGVSHRLFNEALGVDMRRPLSDMRAYVARVRAALRGESPLPLVQPARHPVPVHVAALAARMVELAGEIADGIMCYLAPLAHLPAVRAAAARGTARRTDGVVPELTLGLPTFVDDDLGAARDAARASLQIYAQLPFYQSLFREAGFAAEAEAMARGDLARGLSDRLVESVCALGAPERCRERVAAVRAAGVALPILVPGGHDYPAAVRATIAAFR